MQFIKKKPPRYFAFLGVTTAMLRKIANISRLSSSQTPSFQEPIFCSQCYNLFKKKKKKKKVRGRGSDFSILLPLAFCTRLGFLKS